MYAAYQLFFIVCTLATGVLTWVVKKSEATAGGAPPPPEFKAFQKNYLVVYYLAMMGDWLQGPYVYALYSSYGFSQHDIAVLFVAGFGSSMVFGTFVGALADRFGRKKMCTVYCLLYVLSCVTKHFNHYWILMLGRLTGGIATSLLFSAFESWMVSEHQTKLFPQDLVGGTIGMAIFGNGIVAIVAGVVAQAAADAVGLFAFGGSDYFMFGGYCTPFDLSMLVLGICWVVIERSWSENFGEVDEAVNAFSPDALKKALSIIRQNREVMLCGVVQSLFEGSMYTFVFMWTPVLTPPGEKPPYGMMFATFMVACMFGSQAFSLAMSKGVAQEDLGVYTYGVATVALLTPALTSSSLVIFVAFLFFEACVGCYFPIMGTIKSMLVPDASRAAIYNLFRVPLNAIVLFVLLTDLSPGVAFFCCGLMLCGATAGQVYLARAIKRTSSFAVEEHIEVTKSLTAPGEETP